MADVPQWHIEGGWFDVCKCNVPCPCTFAQPPTYGDCEGVLVWHIREGRYGDASLDGLNAIALSSFEGNIWSGRAKDFRIGLIIDERADEGQREALQMIFSGQGGGAMAQLVALAGQPEFAGLEFAPIEVEIADDLGWWRAEIPGKIEARAEALTGPTTPPGERVQTINPPGSETGGSPATWAIATRQRAEALGFSFEWDGRSSKHIPFDWSGP
jgi:hypothetical protein